MEYDNLIMQYIISQMKDNIMGALIDAKGDNRINWNNRKIIDVANSIKVQENAKLMYRCFVLNEGYEDGNWERYQREGKDSNPRKDYKYYRYIFSLCEMDYFREFMNNIFAFLDNIENNEDFNIYENNRFIDDGENNYLEDDYTDHDFSNFEDNYYSEYYNGLDKINFDACYIKYGDY